MALTNVAAMSVLPERHFLAFATGSSYSLDDNGKAIAYFLALAPGDQIDSVGLRVYTKTGSPGPKFVVGVEGASTTQGEPSGTYLTGIDNTTAAKSAVLDNSLLPSSGIAWISLANPYKNAGTTTKFVAVTVRHAGSGTDFSGSDNFRLGVIETDPISQVFYPFAATLESGDWSQLKGIPAIAVRDSSRGFLGGTSGIISESPEGIDATATYPARGLVWKSAYGCRISAVNLNLGFIDNTAEFRIRAYRNGSEVLNTPVLAKECEYDEFGGADAFLTIPFSPFEVRAGDVLRLVVQATAGTLVGRSLAFGSSADRLAFTRGLDIQSTKATSAWAWTDDDTTLFSMTPVIDQIDFQSAAITGPAKKISVRSGLSDFIANVFVPSNSSPTGKTDLAHNTPNLKAFFTRNTGAAATEITLVDMTLGSYTSGGFKEISDADMPGWYQFCIPDAALVAGADSVAIMIRGADGMLPVTLEIALDEEVVLAPKGFNNLGAPAEPTNTTLATLTWPERLWYASQWVVGGRIDDRDAKTLTLSDNSGDPKASTNYTDVDGTLTIPAFTLTA
ncbi:MAG TPA: hypothetical protein VF777_02775 [Phycisphaerales bacterium]